MVGFNFAGNDIGLPIAYYLLFIALYLTVSILRQAIAGKS